MQEEDERENVNKFTPCNVTKTEINNTGTQVNYLFKKAINIYWHH